MAGSASKDLFLNVGANIDPLSAGMKAAKTLINDFGTAAVASADQAAQAFQTAMSRPGAAAKAMEQSAVRSFQNIRASAQAAIAANSNAGALEILNANAAKQAADASTATATALRIKADAAVRAAEATTEDAAAMRSYAAGALTAAAAAEHTAEVMQAQARVASRVEGELHAVGQRSLEVAEAHGRMGASGMIAEHVVRAFSDSIAAGQSPLRALTMELPRVSEAMMFFAQETNATEGALGKFAGFMGGPWGLAISAGLAVLGPLAAELIKGGDAADDEAVKLRKNADSANLAEAAKRAFMATEAGAISDVKALTTELDKQNESLRTNAERLNIRAKERLDTLGGTRTDVADQLTAARARLANAQGTTFGAAGSAGAGAEIRAAAAEVTSLEARLAAIDGAIREGNVDLNRTRIDLAAEQAKRDADPTARINKLYDDQAAAARRAATASAQAGATVTAALTRQLSAIEANRKAAIQAEAERKQAAAQAKRDGEQSGRKVSLSEAEDIVHGIGGRITSTTRSTAEQQTLYDRYMAFKAGGPWAPLAAKPGTSEHERGQALDIAKGGGMSLAKITEAFRAEGVRLTERLDEGDHFHVAWGAKGARGPSDETLAKRHQAAQDKQTRDAEAYAQTLGRAQEEALKLRRQQVTDYGQAARLDTDEIELERQRLNSAAKAGANERKWTEAQAQALIAQNNVNAALKTEAVKRAEGARILNDLVTSNDHARAARDALLQIDADMADTRKQRLAIEQDLLADEQDRRRKALMLVRDTAGSQDERDQATEDLKALPAQDEAEKRRLAAQHKSPLQSYHDQLTGDVGDMGDALEGVAVTGIRGLQDGLVGVLSGTKTLAQGFKQMADSIIADLARIAVEKLILSVIGLKDGGLVQAFAGGGAVFGAGGPRDDKVPAMLSAGEFVVNAQAYAQHPQLVHAINSGALRAFADGGLVAPSSIYMRSMPDAGAITRAQPVQMMRVITEASPYFDTRVVHVTSPLAQAAMMGGAEQARQDRTDYAMAQIP